MRPSTTNAASSVLPPRSPAFAGLLGKRLVEVSVQRLHDVAAVESLSARVYAAVRQAGPGAVICADFRAASPLPFDVASAWSRDMRRANHAIARSGILLDPSNVMFNLQLARVVQCAGHDSRRLFTDPRELCDWLGVLLTEDERASLRSLIARPGEPPSYAVAPGRGRLHSL